MLFNHHHRNQNTNQFCENSNGPASNAAATAFYTAAAQEALASR